VRPVHQPALVRTHANTVQHVQWTDDAGVTRGVRIVAELDRWEYVSGWWAREVRRSYRLLESDRGGWIELYREGDGWWVARASD
jgi:hypothetical protein